MKEFKPNTVSKKIGENTYYVNPFPPFEAFELLGDLQAVVTSSLCNNKPYDDNDKADDVLDKKINFFAIIGGIGKNLNGKVLVQFADRLLDENYIAVKCKGETEAEKLDEDARNVLFTGHLKEMSEVLLFIIEVNFKDFFDYLKSLFGGAIGKDLMQKLMEK